MSKALALATALLLVAVSAALPLAAMAEDVDKIVAKFDAKLDLIKQDITNLRERIAAPGLPPGEVTRIVNLQANLARRADALWKTTLGELRAKFQQTREEILQFNESIRQLAFEATVIGSHVDLLNNLGTFPVRAEFEQNVTRLNPEWESGYGARLRAFGADFDQERAAVFARAKQSYSIDLEAHGYGREAQANPYVPGTFAKYFAADGTLSADEWEKDAGNWGKYRKATEAFRIRQQERRAALGATADRLNTLRDRVVNARQTVGREIKELLGQR